MKNLLILVAGVTGVLVATYYLLVLIGETLKIAF